LPTEGQQALGTDAESKREAKSISRRDAEPRRLKIYVPAAISKVYFCGIQVEPAPAAAGEGADLKVGLYKTG